MYGLGNMIWIPPGIPASTLTQLSTEIISFLYLTRALRCRRPGAGQPCDAILKSGSGTVVVWSKLDKIQWKTGRTVITNTSREVGRIHRHWIDADLTRIRAASFLANRPSEMDHDTRVVANDPLYLMQPSSTPPPWDDEPMFQEWTSTPYTTTVDGKEVTIDVRYSIVKADALQTFARIRKTRRHGPRKARAAQYRSIGGP